MEAPIPVLGLTTVGPPLMENATATLAKLGAPPSGCRTTACSCPLELFHPVPFLSSLQPQRGCDLKPRVGPSADLPWVRECDVAQPQRGCGPNDVHPPLAGRVATPLGLMDYLMRSPRVARSSQPWALSRSPFGAGKAGLSMSIRRKRCTSIRQLCSGAAAKLSQ
jgi:hypothetical protein